MDIFWEFQQQGKIHKAKADASGALQKAKKTEDRIRDLEKRIDRISLVSQAMWELVRENTGWSDEDILSRISEIDLRDGVKDGKMGAQVIDCPNCKGKINSRKGYCMICGTEAQAGEVFES